MAKEKWINGKHGKVTDGAHDGLYSNIKREQESTNQLREARDIFIRPKEKEIKPKPK